MSAYPIVVRSLSMDHRGGTKSYHLMLVAAQDGKALFITRWGKKGANGDVLVEQHDSIRSAEKAWDRKEKSKSDGGYAPVDRMRETTVNDATELRSRMGLPVWAKVGKNVAHVDPTIDVSGMRETNEPEYDEQGRKRDTARKADLSAAIAAQKEAERAETEQTLRANPNFGRFG